MGQIHTMMTNSKRRKNLRLVTWNVRSLYRPGGLRITINELTKYKIAIEIKSKKRGGINRPHKPLRAMVITSIPAARPIIMDLEQLF
jgi:hypothetical protein